MDEPTQVAEISQVCVPLHVVDPIQVGANGQVATPAQVCDASQVAPPIQVCPHVQYDGQVAWFAHVFQPGQVGVQPQVTNPCIVGSVSASAGVRITPGALPLPAASLEAIGDGLKSRSSNLSIDDCRLWLNRGEGSGSTAAKRS